MKKLVCRTMAVDVAGKAAVDALDRVNCEMTCRITDGGPHSGCEEFAAHHRVTAEDLDGDKIEILLSAYWYIDKGDMAATDELDTLDWDAAFAGYDISEFQQFQSNNQPAGD